MDTPRAGWAELLPSLQWFAQLLVFRLDSLVRTSAAEGGGDEKDRAAIGGLESLIAEAAAQTGIPVIPRLIPPALPSHGWLPDLSRRFRLDPLESLLVVAGVAPTLDPRLSEALVRARGGAGPGRATAELLGQMLALSLTERVELTSYLAPMRRLDQLGLVAMDHSDGATTPLALQPIEVPARVRVFLTEGRVITPDGLRGSVRVRTPRWTVDDVPVGQGVRTQLVAITQHLAELAAQGGELPVVFVEGAPGGAALESAECVAARLGLEVLEADIDPLLFGADSRGLATQLMREALLRNCLLFVRLEHEDLINTSHYRRARFLIEEELRLFPHPLFVTGNLGMMGVLSDLQRGALRMELKMPDRAQQRMGLTRTMARMGTAADEAVLESILNRYSLDHRVMDDIVRGARVLSLSSGAHEEGLKVEHLERAIDLFLSRNLGNLSSRLSLRYGWDDLLVSPQVMDQLKALRYLIEYRHEVFETWGLGKRVSGRGVKAILTGPSGTGKTMAAEVIAADLRLPLYRVDLSQIASKWLGESEKNIDRIFTEAQASQAMLLFDEADALFGKRNSDSEEGGSYNNLSVNFLLQRFENYDGVTILTSNFPQAIDEAFIRRMHFWIEFQAPDEEQRRRLWRSTLVSTLPLGKDLDIPFLASRFEFSGANIKNVVMSAAFMAAAEEKVLGMSQIVRAIQWEFQKLGRTCSASDFGPWYKYLPMA